jgi:formimidoylglutamate deiminase
MAGCGSESALDHLIFAGGDQAIRDVMVAGHWVIKDRHHRIEAESSRRYSQLLTGR